MSNTFQKILIANRGEIAIRIARTCNKMGITPVAIYAWADKSALHVKSMSEAYALSNSLPVKAYLDIDEIIQIAENSNCSAIHPGYGFLSENADFANACKAKNITFIGPSAESMSAVGNKVSAKKLAEKLSVPSAPWAFIDSNDKNQLSKIQNFASKSGYPFLIKASAGGGGRGMRIVKSADEIENALTQAAREAQSSFGNPEIFCEKLIENARHIEVQFIGDNHGNVFTLYDRDCSAQRNHQKVIEEAPALNLSDEIRLNLYDYTKKLAQAINYTNAGTAEFLVGTNSELCFLEVNSRLQVEHPVSEAITGLDFVELQIRSAMGENLSKHISLPALPSKNKHAIEFRVCAEIPQKNFLPTTGIINMYEECKSENTIRYDSGVTSNSQVSPYFDSMLLKIICSSDSRTTAINNLKRAVAGTIISGLENNLTLLTYLLSENDFVSANYTTSMIKNSKFNIEYETLARTAGAIACIAEVSLTPHTNSTPRNFRIGGTEKVLRTLYHQGYKFEYVYEIKANKIQIYEKQVPNSIYNYEHIHCKENTVSIKDCNSGEVQTIRIVKIATTIWLSSLTGHFKFDLKDPKATAKVLNSSLSNEIKADLPGKILQVNVKKGDIITLGQPLVLMESMKMEHTISAPASGTVRQVNIVNGDQVDSGLVLLEVEFKKE